MLDDESASDELDVYGQPLAVGGVCEAGCDMGLRPRGAIVVLELVDVEESQSVMSMSAVGATIFDLKVLCASSRGVNPAAD